MPKMPTSLRSNDRPRDLAEIQDSLESLCNELCGEIQNHADDPKAQSLLQTGADVVAGLAMAFRIHQERYAKGGD